MASCFDCVRTLWNASSPDGTTAFERVFMAQGVQAKEGILVVAALAADEADFSLPEVAANVELAAREHLRLRQVLTSRGLWVEVPVDVAANHLRWLEEDSELILGASGASKFAEQGPTLLRAMVDMPAFRDSTGRTPLWQVLVSRRRVVIHVHHAIMDGVGLALVAGSVLLGLGKRECAELLRNPGPGAGNEDGSAAKVHGKAGARSKCWDGAWHLTALRSLIWHMSTPLLGAVTWRCATPVSDTRGESVHENVRYVHLGPFPLEALKARAKAAGVTLNTFLLGAMSEGIRNYAASEGAGSDLPLNVVVPVNFKLTGDLQQLLHVNNDFSTMLLSVPAVPKGGGEQVTQPLSSGPPVAVGAWAAQTLLSLLPRPAVKRMVNYASRLATFVFSNVNGSRLGDVFVSRATGARKRVACHAYGALAGSMRLFLLANSHGGALHIGLTLDETVVRNRAALASALEEAVLGRGGTEH